MHTMPREGQGLLHSAKAVVRNLRRDRYCLHAIGVTRAGGEAR